MTTTLDTGTAASAGAARHSPAAASSFKGDSPNLDLIRAVAVLAVFFAHLQSVFTRTESIWSWRFGQMGVCIFFVHTSFVLMLSLERAQRRGESLFGDFYIRRLFRLMPLSMFCVTFVYLFVAPDTDPPHWSLWEYFASMTLIHNLTFTRGLVGITWSLALELQMYLVLPFLFLFGRSRPLWALLALWVVTLALGILQPMVSARAGILHFVPSFMAGIIGWRLSLVAPRRVPGWAWPFAFVASWAFFLTAQHDYALYFRSFFCLVLGFSIPWFQEMRLGILNRAAHIVAKYSYGIYLAHTGVLWFAVAQPWPMAVKLVFVAVSCVVLPFLMYHLIEHPMIQVGMRAVSHSRRLWRSRSDAAW